MEEITRNNWLNKATIIIGLLVFGWTIALYFFGYTYTFFYFWYFNTPLNYLPLTFADIVLPILTYGQILILVILFLVITVGIGKFLEKIKSPKKRKINRSNIKLIPNIISAILLSFFLIISIIVVFFASLPEKFLIMLFVLEILAIYIIFSYKLSKTVRYFMVFIVTVFLVENLVIYKADENAREIWRSKIYIYTNIENDTSGNLFLVKQLSQGVVAYDIRTKTFSIISWDKIVKIVFSSTDLADESVLSEFPRFQKGDLLKYYHLKINHNRHKEG